MKRTYLVIISFALTIASFGQGSPNFIVILADDQGWTGTSVAMDPDNPETKSDFYETPNLETLAARGMRFSQAYASAPKCSPSRMSMLTGQTSARNHFTNTSSNVTEGKTLIEPSSNKAIPDDAVTIGTYLGDIPGKNYTSAYFGKWHLGNDGPEAHGFDASDGTTSNGDGDNSLSTHDDPKQIFSMTQRGIDFMNNAISESRPFYLQLSHYAVHTQVESTAETLAKYENKAIGSDHDNASYAAMTEDLDASVGLVLAYLEEKGIADNTYVIYTSDNGAQTNLSSNAPLKYGKTFVYEGGIRVPMIVAGPNIPANSHSKMPIVGYDFLPTIYDLIGENLDDLKDIDGVSFKSVLESGQSIDRDPLIFHSPHYENNRLKTPRSAIVDGEHKIVVEYETGERQGYDLGADIGESSNVFDFSEDEDAELLIRLRDYFQLVDAQLPLYSSSDDDTDSDGLPDEWEFSWMLGTLYDASDDPDNDGYTNTQEYENETDPLTFNEPGEESESLSAVHIQQPIIYPNPTTSELRIRLNETELVTAKFTIRDINGRLFLEKELMELETTISVESLPRGIYIYHISNDYSFKMTGRMVVE
ncbi:MAG: sulfatase-like hydrolase/transferase [Cyclobacteriaceae bacterium]